MKPKVKWLQEAKDDVKAIEKYIIDELGNPAAAKQIIKTFFTQVESLGDHPMKGAVWGRSASTREKYRFIPCENYLIYYSIEDSQDTILVVHILYKRRNINSILD